MRKPTASSNFAAKFPDLARQWHPTRNSGKRPEDFLPKSNEKVWWQCPVDPSHEWEAVIASRHKAGCPHCYNERYFTGLIEETDGQKRKQLLSDIPTLFSELVATGSDRERLGKLYVGNTKKLTWQCTQCHQQWTNQLRKRAIDGQGCTYCTNQTTYEGNSLLALHPDLAAQWDHEKNSVDVKVSGGPSSTNPGTHDKAWWRCALGHSWRTEIRQRVSQGTGCPKCNPAVSKFEVRIGCEIQAAFGVEMEKGKKVHGAEADLLLPSLKIIIEIDGFPWHSPDHFPGSFERDLRKNKLFAANGYTVLRVREVRLPPIDQCDSVPFIDGKEHLIACKAVVAAIAAARPGVVDLKVRADGYQDCDRYFADAEFNAIVSTMHLPGPGESLQEIHPELVSQWCVSNLPLTPNLFRPSSKRKVIWKCEHGHTWSASIYSRANLKTGCPKCSGRDPVEGKTLADKYPDVAAQWDFEHNDKGPGEVTPKSSQVFGWRCELGHTWQASVNNRTRGGNGCPYCAHKLPSPEWNLAVELPEVAKFFDTEKNTPWSAQDVMPKAGKIFWWRCLQGHEWSSRVDHQARYGPRCRQCEANKVAPSHKA